jgi:hypothetical protein
MTARRTLHDELRRISVDTVAVVQLFEQGRFAEASLRAEFIGAAAQRAGLCRIQEAAAALKIALRPPGRTGINSIDSGLADLVREVERASQLFDPVPGPR